MTGLEPPSNGPDYGPPSDCGDPPEFPIWATIVAWLLVIGLAGFFTHAWL